LANELKEEAHGIGLEFLEVDVFVFDEGSDFDFREIDIHDLGPVVKGVAAPVSCNVANLDIWGGVHPEEGLVGLDGMQELHCDGCFPRAAGSCDDGDFVAGEEILDEIGL